MNKNELRLILEEGEGYKIEFKESLANIDREIVAFANSSGGRIFVGITDGGKIKGIKGRRYPKDFVCHKGKAGNNKRRTCRSFGNYP